MAAVTVTLKVESDDTIPVPIDGVDVRAYTDPGDSFVTSGVTGVPTPTTGEGEVTLTGAGGGIGYLLRFFKAGVSFQGSTFPIVVTDPPAPPNFFTFQGHVGETALVATFSVKDDQGVPVAVEGVVIRIYDDSDIFLTELVTDVSGEADLPLVGLPDPGQNYIVRLFKAGYEIQDGPTQTVAILDPVVSPQSNIFDFTAVIPSLKVSADPDMCLLSGYLVDASLTGAQGVNIRFIPREGYPHDSVSGLPFTSDPTIVRNRGIVRDVIAQVDKNGYVEVALPRCSTFDVTIHGLETPGAEPVSVMFVPDTAGANILDVLWPYISEVTYAPTTLALNVGDVAELAPTVITSNLQPPISGNYSSLLVYSVADPSIAEVTVTSEGNVSIKALVIGVTTLEVARVSGTAAPHRPLLGAVTTTPPTITVT